MRAAAFPQVQRGGGRGERMTGGKKKKALSSSLDLVSCRTVKREEVKGNQIAPQPWKTHLLESLRRGPDRERCLSVCAYVV